MALSALTKSEKAVIYECLSCVAEGKVILHDQEFQTIIGISVGEFLAIHSQWPNIDDAQEDVALAINNAMNNLLGYPHEFHERWHAVLKTPRKEVTRVLMKWRGKKFTARRVS